VANDDWRVTVTLHDQGDAGQTLQSLHEHQVEDDVQRRLGQRVAVSADGPNVFLYAGSEDAAREADRVVREVLAERHLAADSSLDRWHHLEERWEDANVAMPQTAEQRQEEHERLVGDETTDSVTTGLAQWEVRVELPSHHDAVELADRLRREGRSVTRRWKFLVVGANNEDEARDLARAVEQEVPAGASVHAEEAGAVLPFLPF
jgi:hypothetical protein